MKTPFVLLSAALLAFFSAGCVTSTLKYTPAEPGRVSSSGAPVSYVVEGQNSGIYLFYYIPLWTGTPQHFNQRDYDLLEHRINDKAIYRMFDVAAKRKRAARYEDVEISFRSSGIWALWIIWKRSVHGRAVLIDEKRSKRGKQKQ